MFVYVDNAATTQVDPDVAEKVIPCFTSVFGNASSIHTAGRKAKELLDTAREQVANALGADVRVSDDIFKQLSQAYLKIRNTARYMLGNLNGFDPDNLVSASEMNELDKWAVSRLNELILKVRDAYENYAYHIVYHAIRNFCVVDMSNFYLDVVKDILYCDSPNGKDRRSAQTAMFLILDSLVKMLSPILAFTSDEIWKAMPHRSADNVENVIFNDLNEPFDEYALSAEKIADFDRLSEIRDSVNLALEAARNDKLIGKPLEAKVIIAAKADDLALLNKYSNILKTVFIVSGVDVIEGDELSVKVDKADGEKCERCWTFSESVGHDHDHPTLCARCSAVVKGLQ